MICSLFNTESSAFTIEQVDYDDEIELVRRKMKLSNYYRPNDQARLVHQLQLKNWPTDQTVPSSRNAVLRLVNLIKQSRAEQETPTRVLGKHLKNASNLIITIKSTAWREPADRAPLPPAFAPWSKCRKLTRRTFSAVSSNCAVSGRNWSRRLSSIALSTKSPLKPLNTETRNSRIYLFLTLTFLFLSV